jgi:hypothetical protein
MLKHSGLERKQIQFSYVEVRDRRLLELTSPITNLTSLDVSERGGCTKLIPSFTG